MSGLRFTSISDAIIASVLWYENMGVATTHADIRKFLWRHQDASVSFAELDLYIESLIREEKLYRVNGFISIGRTEETVWNRHDRRIASHVKMKKAMRFVRLLSFVPGLRMAALCNTSGLFLSAPDGDIDFFIIAKRGLTWWVRFWAVACVYMSGNLRHEKGEKDAICLSYVIDDSVLDISEIALDPIDPYLAFWCVGLHPVCDDGAYGEFVEANERWVSECFSEWKPVLPNEYWFVRAKRVFVPKWFGGVAHVVQSWKTPPSARDKSVVVSKSVCKLHMHDNRRAINNVWFDTLKKHGISYETESV